jgi:hypothetical protein
LPNSIIKYKLFDIGSSTAKQRIQNDIQSGISRASVPDSSIDRHFESYKQMLEDIKNENIIIMN